MNNIEKVIEKIRKLQALSTSSNQHEAAAAAARAAALLQEYQLDEAALRVDGDDEGPGPILDGELLQTGLRGSALRWRGIIAHGLSQGLGAYTYYNGSKILMYGRSSAMPAMRYMFSFMCAEVERLADRGWKQAKATAADSARSWKHAFRYGAAQAIGTRLIAQRAEFIDHVTTSAREEKAMAVVLKDDEEVRFAWQKFSARMGHSSQGRISSRDGFSAGQTAGHSVNLNTSQRGALPPMQKRIEQ
jgi:hypothetical protein